METRTVKAARNIFWGYAANLIRIILEFVLRTIFIAQIGNTYLGINGLYTNILGMLALSELGIGTSMSYSLYKPIAEGNIEKIKSLMKLFKNAYRVIATVVAVVGIIIIPFLPYIINGVDNISQNDLILFYVIYLFNTVTTYFVSYKYSLVNAYQQNYVITKLEMYFKCITIVVQAIMLLWLKSFLAYLISQSIVGIIQKIFSAVYIDKKYPFLKDNSSFPLDTEDKELLKNNVKGNLIHKLGEVAICQTDNIIISSFISTKLVGYVSNYTLIINAVSTFTNAVFNSLTSSYGNFIASEEKKRQEELLYVNQFLSFIVFGFVTIMLYILTQPFIALWLGEAQKIDNISCALIMLNVYFTGERVMLVNYKTAAGIFLQDRWITLTRSIVNIAVSVALVFIIGLPGVYIGTFIQGIISNLFLPNVVYKNMFSKSAKKYYINSVKYVISIAVVLTVSSVMANMISDKSTIFHFVLLMIMTLFFMVVFYILLYRKNQYNLLLMQKIKNLLVRQRGNKNEKDDKD